MYLPPQFNAKDKQHALALMREHSLGSLISTDDEGMPFVTHLPIHVSERGDEIVLLGHVAKANPHWRFMQSRPKAVVTFLGPHAYMSPKVYPDLARVPTWNYLTVNCQVEVHLMHDPQDKDPLLKHLIADHEPAYAEQWRALDEEYTHKMMSGIVAFEMKVTKLQCKLKLNQHRPEARAAMKAIYENGTLNERALAQWMDKLG
jgi:transcriptional regulator